MKKFFKSHGFLIAILLLFVAVSGTYSSVVTSVSAKFNGITVVLDAGHGARDGGSVGRNGTIEKDVNLKYTYALKEKLLEAGYRVELTRKDDLPLYSPLAKNKKQSDMQSRMKKIKESNPNLVISIHMNSFADSSAHGATTYYRKDDEPSKVCADLVQKSLATYCGARSIEGKVGDYYMVNCSYYTSILIECGFLSNPEEEKLLNTADYMDKFTNAVRSALLLYFGKWLFFKILLL